MFIWVISEIVIILFYWHAPKLLKRPKGGSQSETTKEKESWWRTPWFLDRLQMWIWSENNGRARSRGTLLGSQHFGGGRGACWNSGMGLGRMTSINYSQDLHKTNTRWLMHSWSTFGAKTSHEQTWIHKTHHNPNLGEATTFPLIVYFVPLHDAHIQIAFCPRTPKWESQNCQSWDSRNFGAPTLCADLQLRWGLKQSCSPHRELSNGLLHTTYTQGNQVDSRLLMVESQTANLTPNPFFGHNLCFRWSNGWCEPILNIYISIYFQWYKKNFNPLGFDPCSRSLNIRKSTGTPTPKMKALLGVWGFIHSHFPSLSGFPLGPQPCKPLPWSRAQG